MRDASGKRGDKMDDCEVLRRRAIWRSTLPYIGLASLLIAVSRHAHGTTDGWQIQMANRIFVPNMTSAVGADAR